MAQYNVLYKPYSQGRQNPGGVSFLAPAKYSNVSIIDSKGNVLEDLAAGSVENGTYKYYTRNPGSKYGSNVMIRADIGGGKYTYFKIPDASKAFGSMIDTGQLSTEAGMENALSLDPQATRYPGASGSFGPNSDPTGYGFYPAFLGDQFPNVALIAKYKNMKTAPYQFTDPMEFAAKYGAFNREEYAKNFDLAKQFSLETLDTELQALQQYVPAASALKRQETAIDNIFNQQQRMAQVRSALPGVEGQLSAQAGRAEAYAAGRLPDSMQDRALELGIRSQAADRATAGGFGAQSSVARKASDLMSAQQRFQIGQYGEQLLGQNIATKANLYMAPTEYSDAGTQVKVMPSVSPAQLTAQQLSDINQYSMITPSTALQSQIQQNQFTTQLEQSTRQFNKQMQYNTQTFNANAKNQFAMAKFGYLVNYAGAVAGAYQTGMNTQVALDQQAQALEYAKQAQKDAQTANAISSGISAIPSLIKAGSDIISGWNTGNTGQTSVPSVSEVAGSDSMISGNIPDFSVDTGTNTTSVPSIIDNGVPDFSTSYIEPYARSQGISVDTAAKLLGPSMQATNAAVQSSAGLSTTLKPGYIPVGTNTRGQTVYADPVLAADNTTAPGAQHITQLRQFVQPLGTDVSGEALDAIGVKASDTGYLSELDSLQQAGDQKGFINKVQEVTNQPGNNTAARVAGGLDSMYAAANLYQNWDRMSAAQKSLSLATTGILGYRTATGENLAKTPIKWTATDGAQPLTIGDALNLAALGYNAYQIAANWGDLNNLQRTVGVTGSAVAAANLARSTGLIAKDGALGAALPYAGAVLGAYGFTKATESTIKSWGEGGVRGRQIGAMNAATMAASGAAIGSVIPGVGTAVGASWRYLRSYFVCRFCN